MSHTSQFDSENKAIREEFDRRPIALVHGLRKDAHFGIEQQDEIEVILVYSNKELEGIKAGSLWKELHIYNLGGFTTILNGKNSVQKMELPAGKWWHREERKPPMHVPLLLIIPGGSAATATFDGEKYWYSDGKECLYSFTHWHYEYWDFDENVGDPQRFYLSDSIPVEFDNLSYIQALEHVDRGRMVRSGKHKGWLRADLNDLSAFTE